MNKKWIEIVATIIFALVLPGVMFSVSGNRKKPNTYETIVSTQQMQETQSTHVTTPEDSVFQISVLMEDGMIKQMDMETYLTAVVLQEMPVEFEVEALKAQAVVARTYALRRNESGSKHDGAAVCTKSDCCQGYCDEDTYIQRGGDRTDVEKVKKAVVDTADQVLVYDGELIDATYFSCSGGMTEDAAAVWGADIPYLQSTKSPGEEKSLHYTETIRFTTEEFMKKLNQIPKGAPENWIESVEYTDGGGVAEMMICGNAFTGKELRSLLGLRSTAFVMTVVGDTVTVTTKGFGHRVGMSQYGADAMAVKGSTYDQILGHYYHGTELVRYFDV